MLSIGCTSQQKQNSTFPLKSNQDQSLALAKVNTVPDQAPITPHYQAPITPHYTNGESKHSNLPKVARFTDHHRLDALKKGHKEHINTLKCKEHINTLKCKEHINTLKCKAKKSIEHIKKIEMEIVRAHNEIRNAVHEEKKNAQRVKKEIEYWLPSAWNIIERLKVLQEVLNDQSRTEPSLQSRSQTPYDLLLHYQYDQDSQHRTLFIQNCITQIKEKLTNVVIKLESVSMGGVSKKGSINALINKSLEDILCESQCIHRLDHLNINDLIDDLVLNFKEIQSEVNTFYVQEAFALIDSWLKEAQNIQDHLSRVISILPACDRTKSYIQTRNWLAWLKILVSDCTNVLLLKPSFLLEQEQIKENLYQVSRKVLVRIEYLHNRFKTARLAQEEVVDRAEKLEQSI